MRMGMNSKTKQKERNEIEEEWIGWIGLDGLIIITIPVSLVLSSIRIWLI